jgi:GNAT superfamily N-acetyltransferase
MHYPPERHYVSLSELDRARFGYVTAKAFVAQESEIHAALEFCHASKAEFLIIRCPAAAHEVSALLSASGMILADTLVFYQRDLKKRPFEKPKTKHTVRKLKPGEEKDIRQISAESFAGYYGHYHADPRLERADCDAVYQDWAERSCTDKKVADVVLVAEADGAPAGYLTLKKHAHALELVLSGVYEKYQGQGIYGDLIQSGVWYAEVENLGTVFTSTQLPNIAVQKTWVRCGMEPSRSWHTFHHWFV